MSEIISTRNHHDIYDFVNPQRNPALKASTGGKSVIITGAGEGIGRVCKKARNWDLFVCLFVCMFVCNCICNAT